VRIDVVLDASYSTRQYLERVVTRDLPRRFAAMLGPAAQVTVLQERAFPLARDRAAVGIQPDSPAARAAAGFDKVLHLSIREQSAAMEIVAQDYDVATRFLSPPVRAAVRQPARVLHAALDLLGRAFAATAEFEQVPDDPARVLLRERLRLATAPAAWAQQPQEGDVFVPILRWDGAGSEATLPEAQVVPWTWLVVEEVDEKRQDGKAVCRVVSGSRRPLGVRRRGRIEQLAVAVRPSSSPVTLRLVTQAEPRQPLPGCKVFLWRSDLGGAAESELLGISDQSGRIDIPAMDQPVTLVWVQSGKLLLAKLPIVGGFQSGVVEVPLAEDPARIRAEADLDALRTQLVDLVARRNILLARGRAAVAAGDLTLARSLADELDLLPTRAQFNQRVDTVVGAAKSSDRLAQARIDRLVEETRSVLGQYLDPNEIGALRNEIIQASRQAGG
jgi:hypothetical protein